MSRRCPSCGTSFPDSVAFCGNDGTITVEELPAGETDPRLGQTLGTYTVVARIADGAMGRVYEGRHNETKARVAVKVLHPDVAKDPVAVERFKREADTARELAHPNVVQIIDFGQTPDGSYFMTMEYLEGEELGQVLRRDGKLSPERIVRVLSQMASALGHAHSFGVIHRDLKPDNVFLCRSPEGDVVRILDFGSVKLQMEMGPKLTAFGTTLGSPYYMSPEQAMGKQDVDQRTDVFACAAILYEMLTGKVGFDAPNVAQILVKIMNSQPTPPSQLGLGTPPALDDVVDKGLRKDKLKRYASVQELADAAVSAYGLSGASADWATKSTPEIVQALGGATPAAPKPFGVVSVAPPSMTQGRGNAPVSFGGGSASFPPGEAKGMSTGMMVGLGVGVLVLLGIVIAIIKVL
ncbi:MAG: serine/threonine protein kinase [Sandaracinaceae bacterium]|nr:serine/threonine protein kinase [Sandaracinaceae bacterium]